MAQVPAIMDGDAYAASRRQLMAGAPIPPDRFPLPEIANVVTTWKIFEETQERKDDRTRRRRRKRPNNSEQHGKDYTLDLHSFVRYNPTAKFNTNNFAAVIARGCDNTTSLLFGSGSGVTVFARSPSLGIYACRMYTHLIERTPLMLMPEDADYTGWTPGCGRLPGIPQLRTLEGRLLFSECWRENVVAYGFLGCRISLEQIVAVHPERVKYEPGNFPGLEWQATIVDPDTGKEKMVKNLIFETGMWLIIGAQDITVANDVYYRLRKIAHEFRNDAAVHRENERHDARLNKLWNKLYEPLLLGGTREEISAILPSAAPKSMDQVRSEVEDRIRQSEAATRQEQKMRINKRLRKEARVVGPDEADQQLAKKRQEELDLRASEQQDGYSLLMIAATRGNVENVTVLLDVGENPAFINLKGESILDLIKDKPGAAFQEIYRLIVAAMIPSQYHEEAGIYE